MIMTPPHYQIVKSIPIVIVYNVRATPFLGVCGSGILSSQNDAK